MRKLNCIIYLVAVAWKEFKSENASNSNRTNKKTDSVSKIEKKITLTRKLLSKAVAEREATKRQAKMTKRRVKRRKLIKVECKVLSIKDLTEFIDKLKHRLKNLRRKNKRQKASKLQWKWNNAFQNNQASVYKYISTCGVVDNLLIDEMVLEECRMRKKNLSVSLSHNWLKKVLY